MIQAFEKQIAENKRELKKLTVVTKPNLDFYDQPPSPPTPPPKYNDLLQEVKKLIKYGKDYHQIMKQIISMNTKASFDFKGKQLDAFDDEVNHDYRKLAKYAEKYNVEFPYATMSSKEIKQSRLFRDQFLANEEKERQESLISEELRATSLRDQLREIEQEKKEKGISSEKESQAILIRKQLSTLEKRRQLRLLKV
jgi:hypothetical protein